MTAALDRAGDPFAAFVGSRRGGNRVELPRHIKTVAEFDAAARLLSRHPGLADDRQRMHALALALILPSFNDGWGRIRYVFTALGVNSMQLTARSRQHALELIALFATQRSGHRLREPHAWCTGRLELALSEWAADLVLAIRPADERPVLESLLYDTDYADLLEAAGDARFHELHGRPHPARLTHAEWTRLLAGAFHAKTVSARITAVYRRKLPS